MAGEQELADQYVLRFAFKGAVYLIQLVQQLKEPQYGEVSFKKLSKNKNVTSFLKEDIKDFEAFFEYCKDHGIKYALTAEQDGKEWLWLEGSNQGQMENFLKTILSVEEQEKMSEAKVQGELGEFFEDRLDEKEILNIDELKDMPEYKKAKEAFDEAFKETMEHFSKEYDSDVKSLINESEVDLDFTSFKEIHSKEELGLFLKELNKINASLELIPKDPVIARKMKETSKKIAELEYQHNDKEKHVEKKDPEFKVFENPDQNGEYDIIEFETFEEIKDYLAKQYDAFLPEFDLEIDSISDVQSMRELETLVDKMSQKEIDIVIEKKSTVQIIKEKVTEANKGKEKTQEKEMKETTKESKESVKEKED